MPPAPTNLLRSTRPGTLVLASASPRRRELLEAAGFQLEVRPADIDEDVLPSEDPSAMVRRLAEAKAAAVAARLREGAAAGNTIVIAADTTVSLGPTIFNKPIDDDDARRMLSVLSGKEHQVSTGYCVRMVDGASHARVIVTTVRFRNLNDDDIERWLALGQHRDKAGAYAIQGAAASLVAAVHGSLTNVIGLPLEEVLEDIATLQQSLDIKGGHP